MCSTAQREIARGAVGDIRQMERLQLHPKSLSTFLAAEPASVQERWFARIYLLKPIALIVLCLFWVSTAYVSLGPGWDYGIGLMREGGVEGSAAALTVIAGALGDLAIGLAIAYRPTSRYALYAAIFISLAYSIIGTILLPRLLGRPFGADAENLSDHRDASYRARYSGRPLMLYFSLKYLHIMGAVVLIGTGAGIAFFLLAAHLEGKPVVIAGVARIVVIADFIFTATAVVAQPITGVLLALTTGYPLTEGWLMWSLALYLLSALYGYRWFFCKCAFETSRPRLP